MVIVKVDVEEKLISSDFLQNKQTTIEDSLMVDKEATVVKKPFQVVVVIVFVEVENILTFHSLFTKV